MNRSTTRTVILVTGLITALIHLVVLNLGGLSPLFLLNGLAYLVLLGLFFFNPDIVAERHRLFYYAFMAFTLVTIIAFVLVGDLTNLFGWATKVDEVILLVALWINMSNEGQRTARVASGQQEPTE
ncbi:MAG: hypothetical protein WBR18_04360 [Anaerolineales bacterium]